MPQAFAAYFSSRAAPTVNVKQQPPDEDEIVLLDKENVNPSAFRKKEREGKGKEVQKPPPTVSHPHATHPTSTDTLPTPAADRKSVV